jgi:hypothetical protein
MTCRDCIEEGTATGGPCTEPRHQARGASDITVAAAAAAAATEGSVAP